MPPKIAPLLDTQSHYLEQAISVTDAQIKIAIDLIEKNLASDQRHLESAVLAGVIQALATNYAATVAASKE